MRSAAILFSTIVATASDILAQPIIDEARLPKPWMQIETDLNSDGRSDTLTSTPLSLDLDIITVQMGGAISPTVIPVWKNLTGDPALVLTSPSTFDIRTGCFACGRYHSETLWRMAWRDGALVVAGFRALSVDRLEAKVTICDVNLRTGHAEITVDDTVVAKPKSAPLAADPRDITAMSSPVQCKDAFD